MQGRGVGGGVGLDERNREVREGRRQARQLYSERVASFVGELDRKDQAFQDL